MSWVGNIFSRPCKLLGKAKIQSCTYLRYICLIVGPCRCYIIATTNTDGQRILFSLHFGQLRASNYRGNGHAGSLFSRTCETRFRYRRRVLFILRLPLRPTSETMSYVIAGFIVIRGQPILPRERKFRTRLRFDSTAFQFRRTFTGIDQRAPASINFRRKDPQRRIQGNDQRIAGSIQKCTGRHVFSDQHCALGITLLIVVSTRNFDATQI